MKDVLDNVVGFPFKTPEIGARFQFLKRLTINCTRFFTVRACKSLS